MRRKAKEIYFICRPKKNVFCLTMIHRTE